MLHDKNSHLTSFYITQTLTFYWIKRSKFWFHLCHPTFWQTVCRGLLNSIRQLLQLVLWETKNSDIQSNFFLDLTLSVGINNENTEDEFELINNLTLVALITSNILPSTIQSHKRPKKTEEVVKNTNRKIERISKCWSWKEHFSREKKKKKKKLSQLQSSRPKK